MDLAKIQLSEEEMELVQSREIILTKNRIIRKAGELLLQMQEQQKQILQRLNADPDIKESSPKISRGEQYEGLPYMVLDYPRVFGKNDIAAIRTLFWWGESFSITLQLSGKYQQAYLDHISNAYARLKADDYYVGVNTDPWQHHFGADNYRQVNTLSGEEFRSLITTHPFVKLTRRYPLRTWKEVSNNIREDFGLLISLLVKGED